MAPTALPSSPVPDVAPVPAIRIPWVRTFVMGRIFAVVGSQALQTAVTWQLWQRTGEEWQLGLVGLVEFVPVLLLFVPAGNLADRVPRRRVAAGSSLLLVAAAVGLLRTVDPASPPGWTWGCLALVGVSRAFAAPSIGTILPERLDPLQFAHASAWSSAAFQVASVAGPVAAGALIDATGDARAAYLLAVVGQGAFLLCLLAVPPRPAARRRGDGGGGGVLAGLSFVRRSPVYLAAITLDLFAVLLGGATALLPVFAEDVLHVGATGLGWLRAAPGLGALAMSLHVARAAPWRRPGRLLLAAVAGFGVATVGFGLSRSFALSLACLVLTGVFDAVSVVIRQTLEQMITPDAMRGRVAAVKFVFVGMSNELGAFESGAVASLAGPVGSVVVGGIGTLAVVAVVARRWPQLAAIGPLASLRPVEDAPAPPPRG